MASEADSVKRLAKVTAKLKSIEAERAWNLSKEGKAANKRLKELQLRIKREDKLLEKQAAAADKEQDYKDRAEDRAAELSRLQDSIAESRSAAAIKDRKEERRFQKQEAKQQEALAKERRDFGAEFYDSIFGTYSLIGSLKNIFPKPVQILAGWGLDKFKKGIVGASRKIGSVAKSGFNAMMGRKPDADASPEAKAAAGDISSTDAVAGTKKKSGPLHTWMSRLSGKSGDVKGDDGVIATDSVAGTSSSFEELKKQTALLIIIARASEGPDASKSGESVLESSVGAVSGGDKKKKKRGIFGKMLAGVGSMLGMETAMGSMVGSAFGTGIAAKVAGFGAAMLPAAVILWGITSAALIIKDFIKGFEKGGAAQGIADALGGEAKGGLWSGAKGAMKWAGVGAMAGMVGGPVGMVVGALIGAAFGGLMGWIGSEKIKKGIDSVTDFFGFPEVMSEAEKKVHQQKIDDITEKIANLKSEIIPQIDSEIKVFKDMQEKGKKLTRDEMKSLISLYNAKRKAEEEIVVAEKEMAVLERDLERQKLGNLNQQRSKLQADKFALTHKLTQGGGVMVHGEIAALQAEIRQLNSKISAAEKAGLTTETDSLKTQLALAESTLQLKKDMNAELDIELEKSADAIYAEQKRLKDEGLLSGWESMTFGFKTYGRNFAAGWEAIGRDLGNMANAIGAWIYTPGSSAGPAGRHSTPAKLFGVELKWPDFGKMVGDFWSGDMFSDLLPSWMTTPIGDLIPPIPDFSITAKLEEVTTAIKSYFSNDKGTGIFDFTMPTISFPDLGLVMEALAEGGWAALKAIAPFGPTPQEAFMEVWNKVMATPTSITGNARGGPLGKGEMSLVGERGPEIFVPNASGHIIPNNQLTPGNDIAAASSSMFGGGGGGTTVLTNAPITNSSTSTIVNVQTPRMATDPNTQKQSGYALSGWAKFD